MFNAYRVAGLLAPPFQHSMLIHPAPPALNPNITRLPAPPRSAARTADVIISATPRAPSPLPPLPPRRRPHLPPAARWLAGGAREVAYGGGRGGGEGDLVGAPSTNPSRTRWTIDLRVNQRCSPRLQAW